MTTTATKRQQRTDIHRPGAIIPEDYRYVSLGHVKIEGLGDCWVAQEEARILRDDMARTGGKFSGHAHGGNCHVCGAHCIYTVIFHHEETNSYIRTGQDCAEKLEMGDAERFRVFRDAIKAYEEHRAGKLKARGVLEKLGIPEAWKLVEATEEERRWWRDEESTALDLVRKLVSYGYLSEPQERYLRTLLDRIERRPEIEARRKAERERSQFVGVVGEKIDIPVTVTFSKVLPGGQYGPTTLVSMKDDAGNSIRWFASGAKQHQEQVGGSAEWVDDFERGKRYRLRATVKKHEEYRDWRSNDVEKQTMVTRAKLAPL